MTFTQAEPTVTRIDRHSGLPFYVQIAEQLRGRIAVGALRPGDALPTEFDLKDQYGVSRATVRQALDTLERDGLIYREQGRGTFVAHPAVEQALTRVISFTEDMRSRGFAPGTRVLSAELLPANDAMADKLAVAPGDEVARIERLRLADGEPMSLETTHLVHRDCPGILDHDYANQPLRELLERDYGLRIVSATQAIQAVNASRGLAEVLGVKRGAALLFIERVSYSQYGAPVELLHIWHRGDRYVLQNELRG
ncbi:MAG: GntR family transcriptional regulator [Caldilineales bacterium]